MSRTDLDYLIRHAAQLLREVAERCKRARYGFHQYADCMDTATRLEGLLQIREPRLPSAEQRERIVEIFREFNGKEAINQIEFPGCWVCSGDYSVDEVSMALVAVGIDPNYQGSEGDGPDTNLVFKPKAAVASPQPWRSLILETSAAAPGASSLRRSGCGIFAGRSGTRTRT